MYKTFLDSVHGSIRIPEDICKKIVDTQYFQRLRRIEQNSCRAVYPSARHDRFIHSLGVYHLGCRISDHIDTTCTCKPDNWNIISKTYRIACLLHDVGHTPFSHTFEGFYDRETLIEEIRRYFTDTEFIKDSDIPVDKYTPHELISAWLSIKVFSDILDQIGIDKELMVRMIIGLPYKNEDNLTKHDDFRNIMIELIHGTIDADGLDYVCRDVWAGGYSNFNVNLQRLIDSISINTQDSNYILSFSSKALNEIESVLNVKNFQFLYVINHHKVLLEQYYLIEGVKSAACYHCKIDDREEAIKTLCNFKSFKDPISLKSDYILYRPCDDDFISLMKQTNPTDMYIDQWFSRNHAYKPLWKTRIEFFHIFKRIIDQLIDESPEKEIMDYNIGETACEMLSNSLDEECRLHIIKYFGLTNDQIVSIKIAPKFRQFDPSKIKIKLNNDYVDYTNLKHEGFKVDGIKANFYFWFIDSSLLYAKRPEILTEIGNYLTQHLSKD